MASAACLPMILVCAAAIGQANAATENIADGLITTSDENSETWYYIEVPFNSQGNSGAIINDHVGRGFTVLTSRGSDADAQFNPLYPNNKRADQQWKVVTSNNANKYYLVNKNGKYFGNLRAQDNVSSATEYRIEKMNDYFVKALTNSNAALRVAAQSLKAQHEGNPGNTSLNSITGLPSDNGSGLRTLRFVPVAELDDQYPHIYSQGTATNGITQWFFVKSLDVSKLDAPYLTMNDGGETLELAAGSDQDFTKQLFGFVSSDNDEKTLITCYTATDKYLNVNINNNDTTLKLTTATKGWILRHVIAPKINSNIQGVIRDTRGSSDNDASKKGGFIIKSDMKATIWANTFSTYDNAYTWAYEKAYMVTVSESDDKVIYLTAVSPAATVSDTETYSIISKNSINEVKFTVKVSEGHTPMVAVNGIALSQDAVNQENNDGGGGF